MKKFLLSLAVSVAAFTASALDTPYWFTVNVETEAQPTGAGKVYCSFESADHAKANETTTATKHFRQSISNNNWSGASQTVTLYAEGIGSYALDHYEVNGSRINTTEGDYGTQYRITMTQANNCGAGSLSEEDCIAQHNENIANVVTHIVGVFKEVEPCWFYVSAQANQVEGGTVSVSFDSENAAAAEVNSTATAHFNKSIDPGDYSAVTKNLYIHVAADQGYALSELTVNGAPMQVNDNGDVIYFARMLAANKCGDGKLTEDECLAQHDSSNLPAPVAVAAKFEKITAVTDLNTGAAVKSVKYVNAQGVQSNVPFEGINIVVKTMEDGTQKTTKVIF